MYIYNKKQKTMACSKYTLTNTGTTAINFNYRRCDDAMWEYQVNLDPNQTKNIWLINNTFNISPVFSHNLQLVNDGTYPLTPTPTPTNTPTPSTTLPVTPTQTSTTTSTPTPTTTSTSTPTPTVTPTNTSTLTPTPTITPTQSPTPFPISTITITSSQWTNYGVTDQASFQYWLYAVNGNPQATVVSGFNFTGNTITAQVQYVKNLLLANLNISSLAVVPNGLEYLQVSNYSSSIPTLPSTLKRLYCSTNTNVTSVPTLPSGLTGLTLSQSSNITSIPTLPSTLITLEINGLSSVSGLTTLPTTLQTIDISFCNFNQSALDQLVTQFTTGGVLPKTYWNSSFNPNTPNGAAQAILSDSSKVTTAYYTP